MSDAIDEYSVRTACRKLASAREELATRPWPRKPHEIAISLQKAKQEMNETAQVIRSRFHLV